MWLGRSLMRCASVRLSRSCRYNDYFLAHITKDGVGFRLLAPHVERQWNQTDVVPRAAMLPRMPAEDSLQSTELLASNGAHLRNLRPNLDKCIFLGETHRGLWLVSVAQKRQLGGWGFCDLGF